jgi:cation diffusion facilitator CzcD-associated flavoprotein CzcO
MATTAETQPAAEAPGALEHVDVLIVGAGISGIGAAAHLVANLPEMSYTVLERRESMGGTWDLFRYPGIRSDSDMRTLGYRFKPWQGDNVLADGPSIKRYVEETADEYGIADHVRLGHHVTHVSWDSAARRWTVQFETAEGPGQVTSSFLWACSGYYSYDEGYTPEFAGVEDFRGQVVHPQFWPEDLDYDGKKVVVIGSGATAVTLVPAMSERAGHVTMLQRSPSYIMSIPGRDPVSPALRRLLPASAVEGMARWRNVLLQAALYQLSQRRPGFVKKMLRTATERQLPDGFDVDTHFNPSYDPWDQRMCMVPDGDLFRAIRKGQADVVTAGIDRFTERGLLLANGEELEADIVITATGLKLQLFGGATIDIDGEKIDPHDRIVYKGAMLDGVPNFWFVIGYTNASWTLKADLVSEYVMRVLTRMRRNGEQVVVPERGANVTTVPLMPLDSGYIKRALHELPQAGDRGHWAMPNNYLLDIVRLRRGRLHDGSLRFG